MFPCCLASNFPQANTKEQKYHRILERKQLTFPDQLCGGCPSAFKEYFAHCSSLDFEGQPDYNYLKRIFRELFELEEFNDDGLFDWDTSHQAREAAASSRSLIGKEGRRHLV